MIKKQIIFVILFYAIFGIASTAYADLGEAEKEVVHFMNYLQEMAFTGENTEGIPNGDIEKFVDENIATMAKVYKINSSDALALMDSINNKKALPGNYKIPSMPSIKEREWWEGELKKSLDYYWKKSKYHNK